MFLLVCLSEYKSHLRDISEYMMIDCDIVCCALSVDATCEYDPCYMLSWIGIRWSSRCYDWWEFCMLYVWLRVSAMWWSIVLWNCVMFYVVEVNLCREELCTAHTVFVTYSVSRSMLTSFMIYDICFRSFPKNYVWKITHLITMFLSYEMNFYMYWGKIMIYVLMMLHHTFLR